MAKSLTIAKHAFDQPMKLVDKHNWYGCVRDAGILTHGQMAVAYAIAFTFHNSGDGACFPRDESVAAAASVTRGIVIGARTILKGAGFLEWMHTGRPGGGQGSNRYRLMVPAGMKAWSAKHFSDIANTKRASSRAASLSPPANVDPAVHLPIAAGVESPEHLTVPGVDPAEQPGVQPDPQSGVQ